MQKILIFEQVHLDTFGLHLTANFKFDERKSAN